LQAFAASLKLALETTERLGDLIDGDPFGDARQARCRVRITD